MRQAVYTWEKRCAHKGKADLVLGVSSTKCDVTSTHGVVVSFTNRGAVCLVVIGKETCNAISEDA